MSARIIKWKNVVEHCGSDKKMLKAFEKFYELVINAEWSKPQDIFETFNSADIVACKKEGKSRMVFNVGSNKYRLITGYHFTQTKCVLYVKFIGTHNQYDKVNVCKIDMFKRK